MAVKESRNWLSGQRVDIPDLRAIESGVIYDFKTLIQAFVGNNPYILTGFTIPVAGISGPATALQLVVDGAIAWIPGDANGSFFRVDTGMPNEVLAPANAKVVGSFSPGTNFIGVRFNRATDPTTSDLVSIWDVDAKTEFTKTAPRGVVLSYEIVISNSSFTDTAPIAVVTVSGSNVTSITNAKQGLFRLGRGGASPDINYSHTYATNPENPLTATTNASPDPFDGGDWELNDFKEWMDAVMTEFKRIKNSVFWYSDGPVSGVNLLDLFEDAVGSVMTGRGVFIHDQTTAGLLTWTSDLYIRTIIGPKTYTIPAGSVNLAERQVAYIELVRNEDFQPLNVFTFTSGAPTITGSLAVVGIAAGDYIKALNDPASAWREVLSVIGSTITLTDNYPLSSVQKALRADGGPYTVQVADPEDVPSSGNTYWIAKREAVAQTATIAAIGASGATRTDDIATITTTAPHGFAEGQSIEVSVTSDVSFDGFAEIVSIPSPTTLTYINEGPDVPAATAGGGSVDAAAKIYLRWFGEIDQGEERQIDDNTSANILRYLGMPSESATVPSYNAPFRNIKPGANITSAIGQLDTELDKFFGQLRLVAQTPNSTVVEVTAVGPVMLDTATLGEEITGFLMAFIGAEIDFATGIVLDSLGAPLGVNFTPSAIPASEWLWYSVSAVPSVVDATNRMTVQLLINPAPGTDPVKDDAPRAVFTGVRKIGQVAVQDDGTGGSGTIENIAQDDLVQIPMGGSGAGSASNKLIGGGILSNTTVGPNQELSFTADMYLEFPGLDYVDNTIDTASSPIVFTATLDAAYVIPNLASGGAALTVGVDQLPDVPRNAIIIARREGTDLIVGSSSTRLKAGESSELYITQNEIPVADYLDPVNTGLPVGVSYLADGVATVNGDTVLFTNLAVNNNRVYQISGVGVAIAWTPLPIYKYKLDPTNGQRVFVASGAAFNGQTAIFDGTNYHVNDRVRYFDGVSGNFWEQSSLKTLSLPNNATTNVFTVAFNGSQNMIMDFSVLRSGVKETATIHITTDGVTAKVAGGAGAYIGSIGVTFNATIVATDLLLNATTDNTGPAATLKYFVKRWSDVAGGPTGIPDYNTGGGGGSTPAAGNLGEVQYNGPGNLLAAESRFKWDGVTGSIVLNGMEFSALSPAIVINDNQVAPIVIASYPMASYNFNSLDYSIIRGTDRRKSTMEIITNGTTVIYNEVNMTETSPIGVTLVASVNGANVDISYTSTNTGTAGTLKYSSKRWV